MPFLKLARIRAQKEREREEAKKQRILSKFLADYKAQKQQKQRVNIEKGREYEKYIGSIYEKYNFVVEYRGLKNGVKDEGIDLICRRGKSTVLVQCKCYENSHVTAKEIYQFFGVLQHYKKRHPKDMVSATFWTSQGEYKKVTDAFNTAKDLNIRFYYGQKMP